MSSEFHIGRIVQLKFCADGLCNEQPLSPLQLFLRRADALVMAQPDVSSYTRLPVLLSVVVGDADVGASICAYGYIVAGVGAGRGALAASDAF